MGKNKKKGPKGAGPLSEDIRDSPPQKLHAPTSLSFQHAKPGMKYCLSFCSQKEVRGVVDALRQLTTLTWYQVMQSGTKKKGKKVGLNYETFTESDFKGKISRPAGLSMDLRISSVRASDCFRIFGCHTNDIFYVLWFDRLGDIIGHG